MPFNATIVRPYVDAKHVKSDLWTFTVICDVVGAFKYFASNDNDFIVLFMQCLLFEEIIWRRFQKHNERRELWFGCDELFGMRSILQNISAKYLMKFVF